MARTYRTLSLSLPPEAVELLETRGKKLKKTGARVASELVLHDLSATKAGRRVLKSAVPKKPKDPILSQLGRVWERMTVLTNLVEMIHENTRVRRTEDGVTAAFRLALETIAHEDSPKERLQEIARANLDWAAGRFPAPAAATDPSSEPSEENADEAPWPVSIESRPRRPWKHTRGQGRSKDAIEPALHAALKAMDIDLRTFKRNGVEISIGVRFGGTTVYDIISGDCPRAEEMSVSDLDDWLFGDLFEQATARQNWLVQARFGRVDTRGLCPKSRVSHRVKLTADDWNRCLDCGAELPVIETAKNWFAAAAPKTSKEST